MTRLTLKHALYHMTRMWTELSKTGNVDKPGIGLLNNCYLCAYFSERGDSCLQCSEIMQKVWPNGCQSDKTSVYIKWENEKRNTQDAEPRKKYARQIANEAWNQWEKLKEITKEKP